MFTPAEQQLLIQILQRQCEQLSKPILELDETEQQRNRTRLSLLESALAKLQKLPDSNLPPEHRPRPASARLSLSADKLRVLVCEDDQDVALLVATYLTAAGIRKIDIVHDGIQAVNHLYDAPQPYDLILCDWHMPLKNGLEVHEAMQASERYKHACFMLISGIAEARKIRSAIEGGVNDYVVKPVEQGVLIKKINRLYPLIGST